MTNPAAFLVIKSHYNLEEDRTEFTAVLTTSEKTLAPWENSTMTVYYYKRRHDADEKMVSKLTGEFLKDADMKMEALELMKWLSEF